MIYYIADMHFGHKNAIRFDHRPFPDTDYMDEYMIQSWNGRVTEDDTVYVLGDAFWKNEENNVKILQRLNGHKHLIKGNHDRVQGRLRFHWESIRDYAEINDNDRLVILSHFPIPFYKNQHYGSIMLYGHVHITKEWKVLERWKQELRDKGIPCRMFNVGCMTEYIAYNVNYNLFSRVLGGSLTSAETDVQRRCLLRQYHCRTSARIGPTIRCLLRQIPRDITKKTP